MFGTIAENARRMASFELSVVHSRSLLNDGDWIISDNAHLIRQLFTYSHIKITPSKVFGFDTTLNSEMPIEFDSTYGGKEF